MLSAVLDQPWRLARAHVAVEQGGCNLLAACVPGEGAWYRRVVPFPVLRPAWRLHLHAQPPRMMRVWLGHLMCRWPLSGATLSTPVWLQDGTGASC